ncbi:MAG: arylsulfatase, partial [Opitutae bacterium]|nr:arylsulfatase [Opitutae bacterium]
VKAAEGKATPPPPGKSLVPAFVEDRSIDRDYLWWSHDGNRAIRVQDWKLVATNDGVWELFDLSKDRTETNDLSAKHSNKVKELEKLWLAKQNEFIEDATKSQKKK